MKVIVPAVLDMNERDLSVLDINESDWASGSEYK